MLRVAVLGATGYTGRELLRILASHPEAVLTHATSTTRAGIPLEEAHPALRGLVGGALGPFDAEQVAAGAEAVFSCLPHTESQVAVAALLKANPRLKIIDLSADFRFPTPAQFELVYGTPHRAPHLAAEAAYGLPELFRDELRKARLVANPGCYPTAALLALAPLARTGLLEGDIVVDAKSGISGAGATPSATTHYVEANESTKAYKALAHRHEPELRHQLARLGADVDVAFVPHLVPMSQGLFASAYVTLARDASAEEVQALLADAYAGEPFVRVLPQGTLPDTRHTMGTNWCDVGFALRGRRLALFSALDNLGKGASGQAVQNLNAVMGWPETLGLLPATKKVPLPTWVAA